MGDEIKVSGGGPVEEPAADVEALARGLSPGGDGGLGAQDWDQGEEEACLAMVRAALRLKSSERLEAALAAFGGLPPQGKKWRAGKPLSEAAMAPDAFGFERLLGEQQREAMASEGGGSGTKRLGKWLREGLFNSFYDSEGPDRGEASSVGARPKPVGFCLANDNPIALSKILKDKERRAALALLEPKPMEDPPDWKGMSSYWDADQAVVAGREAGAGFEMSLLWQAVWMKAFRCAALLCALPEFNKPLLRSDGFAGLSKRRDWFCLEANKTFEERGPVAFCFFEWAASMGGDLPGGSGRAAWLRMLGTMADVADEGSKRHRQAGTGMGWPEMFFARAAPHHWAAAAENGSERGQDEIANAMAMLDRFESNGFETQWEALAQVCPTAFVLKEWLEIKRQSEPRGIVGRCARRPAL